MSAKKNTKKASSKAVADPYPIDAMNDRIARIYMWVLVAVFPLMMGSAKYTAITIYKKRTFYSITMIALVLLVLARLLYEFTKENPRKKLTKGSLLSAPCIAEFALILYWFFMGISTMLAVDADTAFTGLTERDNGFVIQTLYIAVFFILSRLLITKKLDSYVFVWGGLILSFVTMLHFFGIDLYGVSLTISNASKTKTTVAYDGPYFGDHFAAQLAVTKKAANFMGPVGNINLGSYILTVCCVVAAGLYINKIKNEWDNKNLVSLIGFGFILWAEMNMNTSAGVVALAVAAVAMLPVMCTSFERLRRILTVYAVGCFTLLFDKTLVDVILSHEEFGKTGTLYLIGAAVFAVAALAMWLFTEADGRTWFVRNIKGKKLAKEKGLYAKPKIFRTVSLSVLAVAVIGSIAYALVVSSPFKDTAVLASGSASANISASSDTAGASKPVKKTANSKTKVTFSNEDIFNEMGQLLRGNFSDKLGHGRLFTWKLCMSVIKYRPLLGFGPDNFKTVLYLQEDYYTGQINKFFGDRSLDKAHNEFFDVLLSNGVVGLVCYLGFFASLLYYAFRRADKDGSSSALGIAVLAYMAHAFFGYQLPLQSGVMWALMGLCAAFIRFEQKEEAQKKYDLDDRRTQNLISEYLSRTGVFRALVIFGCGVFAGCIQMVVSASKNGGIVPLATRATRLEPYIVTAESVKNYLLSNCVGIIGIALMITGLIMLAGELFKRAEA